MMSDITGTGDVTLKAKWEGLEEVLQGGQRMQDMLNGLNGDTLNAVHGGRSPSIAPASAPRSPDPYANSGGMTAPTIPGSGGMIAADAFIPQNQRTGGFGGGFGGGGGGGGSFTSSSSGGGSNSGQATFMISHAQIAIGSAEITITSVSG